MPESREEEQEIASAIMVRQIAAMSQYGDGPNELTDADDAAETLNALIARARKIFSI
jgi:hypothetical protein